MPDARVLRIGVDARELLGHPTGVGRYLRALVDRWTRRRDAALRRLVLYVPAARRDELQAVTSAQPAGALEVREVPGAGGTWWEQGRLRRAAARDTLDVFFAPAYTAPVRLRVPTVVAIHDVSYLAHPEWFEWRSGLRRRWLTRWSAARAACVLTGTEFSRSEIAVHLGLRADGIAVIPYGVTAPPRPPAGAGDRRSAREPLVLFAGSIFNRRHIPELLRAFATLAARDPAARLIVAGENRTYPREDPVALARALGLADRVAFQSYVSDQELGALYARARAFAFLSEYEGFGMTPLEALTAGVPIVVYDTPGAREAYRDAAIFVRPGDVTGIADALERLLSNEADRARVLDRAPAVLSRYSWDRTAEATLAAIERGASPLQR